MLSSTVFFYDRVLRLKTEGVLQWSSKTPFSFVEDYIIFYCIDQVPILIQSSSEELNNVYIKKNRYIPDSGYNKSNFKFFIYLIIDICIIQPKALLGKQPAVWEFIGVLCIFCMKANMTYRIF